MIPLLNLDNLKEFILSKCEPHEAAEVELFFKAKLNPAFLNEAIEVILEASEDQFTTMDEQENEEVGSRISDNAQALVSVSSFLKELL